jgi:hypothetical protein
VCRGFQLFWSVNNGASDNCDRECDSEAEAGVHQGRPVEARHARPHAYCQGCKLQARQGRQQQAWPIIDASLSPSPTCSYRRVPRRRRDWDHRLHCSQ